MSHIFISYSKQDIEFARHLRQLLTDEGFGVWMDETQLVPSERWWSEIEENIESCAAFIVIMSPSARTSDWVENEILFAKRLDKPIFPILLAGDYWPMLANIQFENMTRGTRVSLPPRLIAGLRSVGVPMTRPEVPPQLPGDPISGAVKLPQQSNRAVWVIAAVIALIIVVAVVIGLIALSGDEGDDPTQAAVIPPETQAWLDYLATRDNIPTITNTPTNTPDSTITYNAVSTQIRQTEIAAVPTSAPTDTPIPTDPPSATPIPTDPPTPTDPPSATPIPTETPTPIDVCSNIEGNQEFIPEGMVMDEFSNCIEPLPDQIQVYICHATGSESGPYNLVEVSVHSVDDANGLNGHGDHNNDIWAPYTYDGVAYPGQGDQSILANGCEIPFEDVCPNIDGVQEAVPEGMVLDENSNCVEQLPENTATPTMIPAGSSSAAWTPVDAEFNGLSFVKVPAGCFMMGSEDGGSDESPVHEVCLSEFWIMETEVTNAQYKRCVNEGACTLPGDTRYYDDPAYADHPVVYVDWDQASVFATWLDGKLPTEAQWEYAARGPESRVYPWGDDEPTCELANYSVCVGSTTSVGMYESGASWVGALDMSGNVWEWIEHWYDEDYYGTLAEGQLDPPGPDSGYYRVLRGGAFSYLRYAARAAYRFRRYPRFRDDNLGFRVVVASSIQ